MATQSDMFLALTDGLTALLFFARIQDRGIQRLSGELSV
nr:D157 [uncultured bacterium]